MKEEPSPEQGSQLYQTEYTETKRFEHEVFLAEVVGKPAGGKQIAIIGEPGAGKTTILTKIGAWLIQQAEQQPEEPLVVAWISLASLETQKLSEYFYSSWLDSAHPAACPPSSWKDELIKLVEQKRVWLLLDGLDEISKSDSLIWLKGQLAGWGQSLRVVMTCRINQWEVSAGANAMTDSFDVYRTLDYSYQTSQGDDQVKQFISNWFADNEKVSTQIRTELDAPGKERIKDLVTNPLRLTLLCASWEKDTQALPETQADLYRGFVNYLYKWRWKAAEFPDEVKLRKELDIALGKLAKAGLNRAPINDGAVRRFRFTASEISELWADLPDTLLPAAKNLGWLNVLGEEQTDAVYAFYHPTFQEYFAACSIDHWDYFLPENHEDQPVPCQNEGKPTYRVFEKQWQQVIILWIGRQDINEKWKEELFKKLTNFKDNDSEIYHYISYCFAYTYISEFKNLKQNIEITKKVSEWSFDCGDGSTVSKIIAFSVVQTFLKSSMNHSMEYFYESLIEIDSYLIESIEKQEIEKILCNEVDDLDVKDANISDAIRKMKQRKNILNILKATPQITTVLYEYLWSFSKEEQLDLKSAYVSYQISLKHAKYHSNLEEIFIFKESERYQIIKQIKPNRIRRYKKKIKSTPEFSKYKSKKIKRLFEDFDSHASKACQDSMLSEIENDSNYFLYDTRNKMLKSLQHNQDLNDYLLSLLYGDTSNKIKCRIAIILEDFGYDKTKFIGKLLELTDGIDNSNYIVELLIKLCKITFGYNFGEEEIIAEQTKKLVLKHLISKIISENNYSWKTLIQNIKDTLQREIIPILVSEIKLCLRDRMYDYQQIERCYELITYCAQTLSYPEFHAAWHQTHLPTSPFSPQTLLQQLNRPNTIILDITTLNHHTTPELAQELSNRIHHHLNTQPIPQIQNIPQLKPDLLNLKPHLALILYHPIPTPTLIQEIAKLHTPKQIQIIWLTTTDNILDALPPEQENLVAAIWSSIDRFLE